MAISRPLVDLPLPAGFPHRLVARERLVRRLDAPGVPVALVVAAAGHGKSTVVAEWAAHDVRPTAWVALRDAPAESASDLLQAIAEALDQIDPSDRPPDLPGVLARLHEPRSLVLDDLHTVHAADALEVLSVIADRLSATSRLTVISRGAPALPVGRLRARRRTVELGRSDLVMTPGEARTAMRLAGVEAAAETVEALVRHVEGWPVALDLAAASARGAADASAVLRDFTGEDRLFGEYVDDEILAGLDRADADFLVRTSILDRLSGPVCDAVLCRSDSALALHRLSRSTGLLISLDRGDRWYRHHRLFAEALRARLTLDGPAVASTSHARASRWHAQAANVDAAIGHAAAAGDAGAAGDLLFDNVSSYIASVGTDLVDRWIACFSAVEVRDSPALALAAATSAWTRGELDRAEHLAAVAEATMTTAVLTPRLSELQAGALVTRAAVARGGLSKMAADAAHAARDLPEHSGWLPRARLLEGVALHLLGRRDLALARLQEGARRASVGAPRVRALCLAQLALLADDRGEHDDAAILARRARAQAEDVWRERCPTDALLLAVSAMTLAERGLIDEAVVDARDATGCLEHLGDFVPWYQVEVRIALARAELRLSDVATAKAHVRAAARSLRPIPDAGILREWIEGARAQTDDYSAAAVGAAGLTRAELRVLHLLPTHLSFGEIAQRLCVSSNTVKTQAHAVYRKLDETSRSGAVARGRKLGLLDA